MAHGEGEDPVAVGQLAVHEHEERAGEQAGAADPERSVALGEASAGRSEDDQRDRKEGDAEVGDPVGGAEVVVDDIPQGVEGADHQECASGEDDSASDDSVGEQIDGEALGSVGGGRRFLDGHRSADRQQDRGCRRDDQERRCESVRADEYGGDRGTHGEPEDVGAQEAAEVGAEVLVVGEDYDAANCRQRPADADAGDDAADHQDRETFAESHQQKPRDVDRDTGDDDAPGVAAIGDRCDQGLGEEGGDEADTDQPSDRGFADAVGFAVVGDDREEHAVAGCKRRRQAGEDPESGGA